MKAVAKVLHASMEERILDCSYKVESHGDDTNPVGIFSAAVLPLHYSKLDTQRSFDQVAIIHFSLIARLLFFFYTFIPHFERCQWFDLISVDRSGIGRAKERSFSSGRKASWTTGLPQYHTVHIYQQITS